MIDEAQLPRRFQEGLKAIREREVEHAAVVALDGNFALVSIGVEPLGDMYVEQEAEVFLRLPLNFPDAHPYGIVTSPFLTRKDGAGIERQHKDHRNAQPIAQALGRNGLGFWSWNWQGMPSREPRDLALAVEWGRKRLRQG